MSPRVQNLGRIFSTVALGALLVFVTSPSNSSAQVYHPRGLDRNVSITADGQLATSKRVFNRDVFDIESLPIELVTLDIGNAPILVCATATDAPYLTTRRGELISSLPCFANANEIDETSGNMIDGWPLSVTDGGSHTIIQKYHSLGLGTSRMTRFSRIDWPSGETQRGKVHITVVVDINQDGRLDQNEYSYLDLSIEVSNSAALASQQYLDKASCRQVLRAEADRIEFELTRLAGLYSARLGEHFSIERFSGDSTAVRETKGVFALLARDQFEQMFETVKSTPRNLRHVATLPEPTMCQSAAHIRETADVAIDTYSQLWEATLELAYATIQGWRKVYGKLGQ